MADKATHIRGFLVSLQFYPKEFCLQPVKCNNHPLCTGANVQRRCIFLLVGNTVNRVLPSKYLVRYLTRKLQPMKMLVLRERPKFLYIGNLSKIIFRIVRTTSQISTKRNGKFKDVKPLREAEKYRKKKNVIPFYFFSLVCEIF